MGEDPSVIREEIEVTRERVGDEVDALSYKTDVGARMGDYVEEKKDAVKSRFTGAKDSVMGVVPDSGTIKKGASSVRGTAESNPLGLALGGVAVGFVIGTLVPGTRMENEQMGEMSDRLTEVAKETAGEAAERGKRILFRSCDRSIRVHKFNPRLVRPEGCSASPAGLAADRSG